MPLNLFKLSVLLWSACPILLYHQSMYLVGICLFSNCSPEDVSVEGRMDLESYLQLLEDAKQRCTLLQRALQDYTDAVVHR